MVMAGGAGWYWFLPDSARAALYSASVLNVLMALIFAATAVVLLCPVARLFSSAARSLERRLAPGLQRQAQRPVPALPPEAEARKRGIDQPNRIAPQSDLARTHTTISPQNHSAQAPAATVEGIHVGDGQTLQKDSATESEASVLLPAINGASPGNPGSGGFRWSKKPATSSAVTGTGRRVPAG